MKKNAKKFAYIKNLLYLCIEIKKQDGAATRNSGKKDMTLTSYTKYVLNEGNEIIVKVANFFGFDEKQIAKLIKAGAIFNENKGWSIRMTKEDYLQKCKALKGFQMEYFTMA